jgi:alkaline phosphatase D
MKKLFTLLLLTSFSVSALMAQQHNSAKRSVVDEKYAPFYHGVASGDPLSDRVIIWTRVTTNNASETVNWEVAADTTFATVVQSGSTTTDASKDFTVKVDVTGLQADTWYYYRFTAMNKKSLIGRTRTTPTGNVANLRFAVMSCSNHEAGYFNAYKDVAEKNDVDAVIHLGDYIYEYGRGGILSNGDSLRLHEPPTEILTLSDYRIRHSQHKLDADLRAIHQQYPFITVWDDHETANNSWRDGAENHTPGTEGAWADRKSYGIKAYFEWMPIRDFYGTEDTIHRTISFGDLATFIMIDTRLEGRDVQGGTSNMDTNRTLLGFPQLNWFKNELSTTSAQWKLIGNQVMIAPLRVVGIAVNADQWDGYPAERNKVLTHIDNNNIDNVVVLTGDIHSSWANDVAVDENAYNSQTGAGSTLVEYVCTSVTSGGAPAISLPLIQSNNPHIKYADLTKRGYLLLDLTSQRIQGDWVYMSTITDKNFTASVGASWLANNGDNHLTEATAALTPRTGRPILAPDLSETVGIRNSTLPVMLSCYPNPFEESVTLQYYLHKPGEVNFSVVDMTGKTVFSKKENYINTGLCKFEIDINNLPKGNYTVNMNNEDFRYSKVIFKSR